MFVLINDPDVRLTSFQAYLEHLTVGCYRLLISEILSSYSSPDSIGFFQVLSLKSMDCKAMRLDFKGTTMNSENRNIYIRIRVLGR